MELILRRLPTIKRTTLGALFFEEKKICDTLEDVVREDPRPDTPANEAKVYGETAIPAGTYEIEVVQWSKFGPDSIVLLSVPGFQGIFIHGGFKHEHSHGCILVGKGTQDSPDGGMLTPGSSQAALRELKSIVLPKYKAGETITVTVVDA